MKVKESPLVLEKFLVIQSSCQVTGDNKNFQQKHEIQIDFDVAIEKKLEEKIFFWLKLTINIKPKKDNSGLVIKVETFNFFAIKNLNNLRKKEINNLMEISSVSIAISNLREFLKNLTRNYPICYVLPIIDMQDLMNKKISSQSSKKTSTKNIKKNTSKSKIEN